jgi:hypothetical protein
MIRIDVMWLAVAPVDMRAGADRLLARVVEVFGAAQAHHGYLFANTRATRMKLLVHDGFGVWCATRRLNQGPTRAPQRCPHSLLRSSMRWSWAYPGSACRTCSASRTCDGTAPLARPVKAGAWGCNTRMP